MKKRHKKIPLPKNHLPVFSIVKSTSCLLKDGDTLLIMAYMYISKKDNDGKAIHRWEGLVLGKENYEKILSGLESNFGKDWLWPGIEGYQLRYNNVTKCRQGHSWFLNRKKEAKPWNEFYKNLKVNQKNRWPIDDYVLDDGTSFVLENDEDKILSLKGRRFSRIKDKAEPKFSEVLPPKIY